MNQGTGKRGSRGPAAVVALSFLVPLFFHSTGCKTCDHVESELRTRETEVRALRAELYHAAAVNQLLQHELQALRPNSAAKVNMEPALSNDPVTQIVLGWQTGSPSINRAAGEALQVVVEPRDAEGRAVIAPAGSVQVSVLEINPGGRKTRLCSWDVSAEQLRGSWRKGLMSTGYYLVLPWKDRPASDKVRIVVDWTKIDGRVLEADKDVALRSPWPAKRKAPAEPETPLPLPRKVEDSSKTSQRSPAMRSSTIEPASLQPDRLSFPLYEAIQMERPVPLRIANQP